MRPFRNEINSEDDMSISSPRLGIVGIGVMGHGIASTLAGHGYPLVFLDHPGNQPVDDLVAAGARSVGSLSELAAQSDVVILCVTGTPEVEAVLMGSGGVIEHMRPGTVVVDHSTAIPSSTVRVGEAVGKAGGRFLDAPMTGTPKDAAGGTLNLLVGGDRDLFDEYRPLLAGYARRIVYAGPLGAGHQLKLLHNFVSIGFAAVLAEAVACAERAHVDVGLFVEVLANGGGKSTMLDRMRPYIETQDTTAYRFSIGNAAKDLGYYTILAEELGAARATAEAVHGVFADAVAGGHGRETVPEMVTLLAGE
jgi:3-hydroxyisobutyrate dehydrogenase-like beta-hydroxyacid dehydrogenase